MPIEIADIRLERLHEIRTLERTAFVRHSIPGLDGNIVQDMGRDSVRLQISGIFYGSTAQEDVEALRAVYTAREPVDFLAEIVGEAYFAQVLLERFEVVQAAGEPDQFSYTLTVAEFVVPPEPSQTGLEEVDAAILEEAASFMDIAELPDVLTLPEFSDPTGPISGLLDGVGSTVASLESAVTAMTDLFGDA